jgi:hypothetical protein
MLAKIWAFIWPPIDRSPIETPMMMVTEAPQTFRVDDPDSPRRQAPRVPPHQRFQVMTAEQRWSAYSSFRHSPEADSASHPLRRAG